MADFDLNDVIRIGCLHKYDTSEDVVNVIHMVLTGGSGGTFAQISTDIQEYTAQLYNRIQAIMNVRMVPSTISVKNETQNTVWGSIPWAGYTGGTSAGDPTPLQIACLGLGRTKISRVQMRKYLGPFTETELGLGLWLGTALTPAGLFMSDLITAQSMTSLRVFQGCAYNKALARVTFALSSTVQEVPVVQRRRRRGRGS